MTISYPLNLPSHTGIRNIELRATNAVIYEMSPFTFAGQAQASTGQMWQADVTLPPMKRSDAEQWIAWLVSLRGRFGTFTMGDPLGCAPRGTALSSKKNILFYTEQFNNAVWTKNRATITVNAGVAPDGFTTADAIVEDINTGTHNLLDAVPCSANTQYVWSIYLKQVAGGSQRVRLRAADSVGFRNDAYFNFNTNQLTTSDSTKGFDDIGNGWFRIWVSAVTNVAASSLIIEIDLCEDDTNNITYTGDGSSSVLLWGAQVEVGTVPTTYQPIFNGYGPFVNGAGQTGGSLIIDGASPDETGYLLAGDYIQLGSASTATLHKVLQNVDTDSDGNATLEIWPHIRTAPANNAAIVLTNTVGLFRLTSNETSWSVNEAAIYGITFSAMEAIS